MSEDTQNKKEGPSKGVRFLKGLLPYLFGSISYKPPGFLVQLWRKGDKEGQSTRQRLVKIAKRALKVFLIILGAVVLLLGGLVGYAFWKDSRPQKVTVGYRLTEPKAQSDPKGAVPALKVLFNGSAARKEAAGGELSEGILLEPELPGQWRWEGDQKLVFEPARKWSIGTEYQVSMDRSLFPDHITVSDLKFSFRTPDFKASVSSAEFYIDPTDASIKRILAQISFNYPVDPASIEEQVRIYPNLKEDSGPFANKDYDYELRFNEERNQVHIVSEPVGMPLVDVDMTLELGKDIREADGEASLVRGVSRKVKIPGISSFVKVHSLSFQLVKNDRQIYDQLLVLNTKGDTKGDVLKDYLEVWQLPRDLPDLAGVKGIEYFRWDDPEFVTDEVLKLAERVPVQALPTEREYTSLNSFSLDVEPQKYIYVKIRKGAPFYGGYYLSQDYEKILQIRDYPKELEILSEGNILSLSGDKRLSLFSRGVSKVGYKINRILPEDINHLVSQSNGNLTNFHFQNYNFSVENVSKSYNKTISLNMSSTKELQYFSLNMADYLNRIPEEGLRYGLFLIEVGEQKNRRFNLMDRRLVMVSDLGMLIKSNQNGTKDLFVQSIATGRPVSGATVQVLGRNGIPLVSRQTDREGHVAFPSLHFDKNENTPTAFIVTKGEDLSFLPYRAAGRYLDYSGFDIGGVYGAGDPGRLTTQIFSDRGLYRPGDRVNGAFIIKAGKWETPLGGTPLLLNVVDPKGRTIHEETMVLAADGFNDFSFETQDYSPTGNYAINLYLVKERERRVFLGTEEIKVEEFLPDRLKVTAAFNRSAQGWISPENLEAFVSVRNLYGAAAEGNKVVGRYSLDPASLFFPRYREFRFLQPERTTLSHHEDLPAGETDEKGEAVFPLPLDKFEQATYRLRLSVDAYEKAGGRSVASGASVLVSPMKHLVGYKADGDMGYIHKGSERVVEFIAVDPNLERIALKNLNLGISRIEFVSTLVKQPNGVYKYESIEQNEPVAARPLAIQAEATKIALDTAEPGNYAAEVTDGQGNVLVRFRYTIVGESNLTRSLNRSAELEIKLDKSDYNAGEEIEISISAPYAGAGLITIERDKVYAYKWFKSDSTSTMQTIRVPQGDLEGNGYVTISYIRSPDSKEIFMSPLSYGSVPFSLNKESRTQRISLEYPDLVKPGEELPITYSSDKKGRIVIYAVDEGILQVGHYRMPDPLAYFFRKRALEVRTAQILDLILPEFSVVKQFSEAGGGSGADMLASNLNPFKRKDLPPVVYWSGILDSGPEKRTVSYKVPDYFNGSLRVMAVCVSPDAVGSIRRSSYVRDTFIIQPSAPLAVTPGDAFSFQATIANTLAGSGEDAEIRVSLKAGSGLDAREREQTLVIPEGKDRVVRFPVTVGEELGASELTLTAEAAGESSRMTHHLSIRPSVPYRTEIRMGLLEKKSAEVEIERDMYPHFRELSVSASYLPIGLAGGLNFYLEEYPYTCTEQLISISFPKLYEGFVKNMNLDREERDIEFARAIAILQARQKNDGGFGMWTVKSDSYGMIDLYAYHFLLEAQRMGRFVPQELIKRAQDRAEKLAAGKGRSEKDLRLRSYAVFLLTQAGTVTTRYLEGLRKDLDDYSGEWKSDLIGVYMASSYSLLQMKLEAGALLREIRTNVRRDRLPDGYQDKLSYLSQYLTTLSRLAPERLKQVSSGLLNEIAAELTERRFTTFSASMALVGLQSYMDAVDSLDSSALQILQLLGEDASRPVDLAGTQLRRGEFSEEAKALEVKNGSGQPVYYQVTQGGFDKSAPEEEVSKGIEVLRDFLDEEGNPVEAMELGKPYRVRLRIRGTGKGTVYNVALVDLLPACLEPQSEEIRRTGNLSKERAKLIPDYLDIREDRLILYGDIGPDLKEYIYPVRAVYTGAFLVPPLFAEAMYDNTVWALQSSSRLTVGEPSP